MAPSFKYSVVHGSAKKTVKGEDVITTVELVPGSPEQGLLFVLCDGHLGSRTAVFVAYRLPKLLAKKLTPMRMDVDDATVMTSFADSVQQAMCTSFMELQNEWVKAKRPDGTTVTAVLLHLAHGLVTIANVGDSNAVLDTGCSLLPMTADHRIAHSAAELKRLQGNGCTLAQLGIDLQGPAAPGEPGVGPVRLWPGGLCVARSIGDVDCSDEVIPLPHVRQVLLPPRGARLLIASDGVWDVLTPSRAAKLARELSPSEAATELVRIAASNLYGVVDDTSAIVVDLAPSETPMLSGKALPPLPWEPRGWSLLACLKPSSDEPDSRDVGPSDPGHLLLLSDIDALHAYPQLLRRIDSHYGQRTAPVSQEAPADFTMHGSRNSGSRGGSTHGPGESGVRTSNPLADFVARLSHRERSNSSAAKGPPSSG